VTVTVLFGISVTVTAFPVVARVWADGVAAGQVLKVRLVESDPDRRTVKFEVAS
jgi:phosphoribosyl-AMP cyclohydrolase